MSTPEAPSGGVITLTVQERTYELDVREFTGRETGILKRVGHIGGLADLGPALMSLDLEVIAALAHIAARRVGVDLDVDKLLDAELGAIVLGSPEADADVPPIMAVPARPASEAATAATADAARASA